MLSTLHLFLFGLFAYISAFPCKSSELELVALRANAILPTPRYGSAAHYDGLDSIYIIGGYGGVSSSNEILQYSISSDNITLVATLPEEMCCGSISSDTAGNLYYFGGYGSSIIYKFYPSTGTVEPLASLPVPNFDSAAVKERPSSNNIFILGGWEDPSSIVYFNASTSFVTRIGSLPQNYSSMTAVSDGEGSALLFGNPPYSEEDSNSSRTQAAAKLNLTTLEINFGPETMPMMKSRPSAAWDGTHAYIIGGYEADPSIGLRSDTILKFNPETMEHEMVSVTNFPAYSDDVFFSDTSSVYVESLNRIYFVGGYTFLLVDGVYHNEIWFIDL